MHRSLARRNVLAFALLLSQAAAAAAIVYNVIPTDEDLVGTSPVIVFGEVLSSRPVGVDGLFTDFVLRIEENLKGLAGGTTVVVRQHGGRTPDGLFSDIGGLRRFAPGDRVLLFLEPVDDDWRPLPDVREQRNAAGAAVAEVEPGRVPEDGVDRLAAAPSEAWWTVDLGLGAFFEESVGGRALLLRESAVDANALLDEPDAPAAHGHAEHGMEARNAGAFRRWIADRVAGLERPADYVERMPDEPAPPQRGPMSVRQPFTVGMYESGVCEGVVRYQPDPVVLKIETHTAPPRTPRSKVTGDGYQDAVNALAAWVDDPGSNVRLSIDSNRTKKKGSFPDGVNSIRFSGPRSLKGNVLAWTRRWSVCQRWTGADFLQSHWGELNGVYTEADIEFNRKNDARNWNPRLTYPDEKLERLLGHELGHVLGLNHSRYAAAMMYATIDGDGRDSTLHLDDQRGVRFLYPASVSEGSTAELWIVANRAFGESVTFNVTYGGVQDTATGAADPSDGDYDNDAVTSVTFGGNDTSKMIRIPISDDDEEEGDEAFTVTFTPTATLPAGTTVAGRTRRVTIADDDDEGVSVAPAPGATVTPTALTIDEGSSGAYTVKLNTAPSDDVTVTVSGESGDVTVNPDSLTFTDQNYGTAQTVTVSAASDEDATADAEVWLSHGASGGGYDSVTIDDVDVTVTETTPVLQLSKDPAAVTEGMPIRLKVTSDKALAGTLAVSLTLADRRSSGFGAADVPGGLGPRTFNADFGRTASTKGTVSIPTRTDVETESAETYRITLNDTADYELGADKTADGTLNDGKPSVTVTPTSLRILEGSSNTYTVKLDAEPSGNVTVTVSGASGGVSVSGSPLTFAPRNYGTAQTVTVSAAEDEDATHETATLTHSASGGGYNGVTVDSVKVTVSDRTPVLQLVTDPAAVTEGAPIILMVRSTNRFLTGKLEVSLTLANRGSSGFGAADVPGGLGPRTFDANFRTLILGKSLVTRGTLSIPTSKDAEAESAETYRITLNDTADYELGADTTADGTLNDGAGTVSVPATLTVAEGVGSATVTITTPSAFGAATTFSVSYGSTSVTSDEDATGAADPSDGDYDNDAVASVEFGASETTKDISIPITNDDLDESDETFTVTIAPARTEGAGLPDGFTLGNAVTTVTVTDDDASPVLAAIDDATWRVGQTVDVTASATDADNDTIGYEWSRKAGETTPAIPGGTNLNQAQLMFVPTAAGTYTMTVTASDGNGNDAAEEVVITVQPALSVTVTPTALTVEEGSDNAYTVKLDAEPSGNVTVTVSGASGDVTVTGSPLTFTDQNYGTAQTVTVSAAKDADATDDAATLTHSATGGGYNGVTIADVDVSVTETTPVLQLSTDPGAVTEGTAISLTVTSDKELTGTLAVSLTLADRGSSGFDVNDIPGTLGPRTFNANFGATPSRTAAVSIPTSSDSTAEGVETYRITLNDAAAYEPGADRIADGTLNDGNGGDNSGSNNGDGDGGSPPGGGGPPPGGGGLPPGGGSGGGPGGGATRATVAATTTMAAAVMAAAARGLAPPCALPSS